MLSGIKMDQKTKQKFFTFLYILLIVVVIGTCIFLATYLSGESAMCLKDPIQYYSQKAGETCYCVSDLGIFNP